MGWQEDVGKGGVNLDAAYPLCDRELLKAQAAASDDIKDMCVEKPVKRRTCSRTADSDCIRDGYGDGKAEMSPWNNIYRRCSVANTAQ